MSTKSIPKLYSSFRRKLQRSSDRYGPCQAMGRIEDYLVKDFALHIYRETNGDYLPVTNLGNKTEQKIDLAILQGDLRNCSTPNDIRSHARVVAFIEAKYLRNTHRMCLGNARDETLSVLRTFSTQTHKHLHRVHGGFQVQLQAHSKSIYGLIFASFVSLTPDIKEENAFFRDCSTKAKTCCLRYYDLSGAWLEKCYSLKRISLLKRTFYVSLKTGLWRRR